jgi:hypoxanthine phosphoribosyltransferase
MQIKGIDFIEFISEEKIQQKVVSLASEINNHYAGKTPVFLPVLNGSFMFAADLSSTGQLKTLIGLDESLFKQDVVVVEDIVDTGLTLQKIMGELKGLGTRSVEVVALLRKKPAREKGIRVRFTGFEIDDEFVLGYGLDYDGLGRNHRELFKADRTKLKG